MIKENVKFLMIFLFPVVLSAQSKRPDCALIKTGTFYFYPPNSQEKFTIIRDNATQQEINTLNNDTTFFKVNWQTDCIFDLKFIRAHRLVSEDEQSFYDSHRVVIDVSGVTKDYYTFKGGLDSITNLKALMTDTLWFKPR